MVLQQIAFPEEDRKEALELYLRVFGKAWQNGQEVQIEPGASIQTDTYFNGFFSKEWKQYTTFSEVTCQVSVRGNCKIEFFILEQKQNKEKEIVLKEQLYNSKAKGELQFQFSLLELAGIVAVRITAFQKTIFYGGKWEYQSKNQIKGIQDRTIKIALVICTYKKETEIIRNLSYLQRKIKKKESPLFGKIQIYVVDNGRTFPHYNQDNIRIIPHQNTGGAGGFIKGMEEAMKEKERYGFSHILLMDDDVKIEACALEKTCALLSCIKEDYIHEFLGGAMLRQDIPWIQQEAGGVWKEGQLWAIGRGLDLRKRENLLKNNQLDNKPNYAAWWYCCIPIEYIKRYRYPMPFFLHFDDIEYALRRFQTPIYLNGIGIWHESFEQKKNSALTYYNLRNSLFTYQLHGEGKKIQMIKLVLYEAYQIAARYQYRDASLIYQAVKDYRKGINWLYKIDSEALHQKICHMGYHWKQNGKELEIFQKKKEKEILYQAKEKTSKRIWRLFTINGSLLPVQKKVQYLSLGAPLNYFYRVKKVYLYDSQTQKGIWVKKDYKGLFWTICETIRAILLLMMEKK